MNNSQVRRTVKHYYMHTAHSTQAICVKGSEGKTQTERAENRLATETRLYQADLWYYVCVCLTGRLKDSK